MEECLIMETARIINRDEMLVMYWAEQAVEKRPETHRDRNICEDIT